MNLRHFFNYFALGLVLFSFVGCASVGNPHDAFQLRAQKLATGIHKAYAVPKDKASRLSPIILQNADVYRIEPELIAALIQQESSYRSNAISPIGAMGLTQVVPRFWQKTCPGDLMDEVINIQCGAMILSSYFKSAGYDWFKTLGYYNVGPTGYENIPYYRDAGNRYAKSVFKYQQQLKEHF
ncbi:hypothetical protein BJI46_01675 [Acinetobacter qingfengensis]|uniref:Transglycosylase SLT domain-containing protein n=1 Tax=Acinetobacter qingfengensis TaxID=1262585 RepID=A0A1E7RD67_9GAMM|nr:hypothetical protein BJI46_01675 [Acinetobacter qingfengensis]